jgi:hypothetical protein
MLFKTFASGSTRSGMPSLSQTLLPSPRESTLTAWTHRNLRDQDLHMAAVQAMGNPACHLTTTPYEDLQVEKV